MDYPIYSMTAYARHQADFANQKVSGQFTWELRSVNQRYLELHFKLPDALKHLEPNIRELMKAHVSRGKIDVNCSLFLQQQTQAFSLNHSMLAQLKSAIDKTCDRFETTIPVDPLEVLKWPGILDTQEAQLDVAIENQILTELETALEQLKSHRLREGQALGQVLLDRCNQIQTQLEIITPLIPEIRQQHLQKLEQRISHLSENLDHQRLHQEAAILAQKIDIDEELQRLQTHLIEIRHILKTDQPKGRRLDFLMQELNREANTLGSKSIDARTSQASVELKVLIEQMREQIQNIE